MTNFLHLCMCVLVYRKNVSRIVDDVSRPSHQNLTFTEWVRYLVGPCEQGRSVQEVVGTSNQPPHPRLMSDSKMTIMITHYRTNYNNAYVMYEL